MAVAGGGRTFFLYFSQRLRKMSDGLEVGPQKTTTTRKPGLGTTSLSDGQHLLLSGKLVPRSLVKATGELR